MDWLSFGIGFVMATVMCVMVFVTFFEIVDREDEEGSYDAD